MEHTVTIIQAMYCTNSLFVYTIITQIFDAWSFVTEVLNNIMGVKEEIKLKIKFASSPRFAKSNK